MKGLSLEHMYDNNTVLPTHWQITKAPFRNQGLPGLFQVLNCNIFSHQRSDEVLNIHNCGRRRVSLPEKIQDWNSATLSLKNHMKKCHCCSYVGFLHRLFISRARIKWEVQLQYPCCRWCCLITAGEELCAASSASYLSFQHGNATKHVAMTDTSNKPNNIWFQRLKTSFCKAKILFIMSLYVCSA